MAGRGARGVAVKFGRERATADDAKNLADSFSARGFAVEAWDADLDAQNGEGLVWAQVARAGNWVTAQLPKQAAAVARPKQPPRKPAPADRVDRTRVGYALETLGAGRTRAIFTVPDGAEELEGRRRPPAPGVQQLGLRRQSTRPGPPGDRLVSPTPEATARTIAARLTARLTDPGGTGAEDARVVSYARGGLFL